MVGRISSDLPLIVVLSQVKALKRDGQQVFWGGRWGGGVNFQDLPGSQGQYTIYLWSIYILHRCPKCFESVTLIQQHKGGALKGPAKGHCLNCMDEQEYDLKVPTTQEKM